MRSALLVDDEPYVRKGLRALIERSATSFQDIVECENGRDALHLLSARHFDLAIVDVRMPFLDGIALIREAGSLRSPPRFVVLSGYDEFQYAKEAIRHGARDYLLKPVDRAELLEVLARLEGELQMQESAARETDALRCQVRRLAADELNYLLLNPNVSVERVAQILSPEESRILSHGYRVCLVGAPSGHEEEGHYAPAEHCVSGYLAAAGGPAFSFLDPGGNIAIISGPETDYDGLAQSLAQAHAGDFALAVSGSGKGADCLRRLYGEACEALRYRPIRPKRAIIRHEALPDPALDPEAPAGPARRIGEMLGANRLDEINRLVNLVFDATLVGRSSIRYVERSVACLSEHALDAVIARLPRSGDSLLAGCARLKELRSFNALPDYVIALKDFLAELNEYLMALRSEYRDHGVMEHALDWLKKNACRTDMSMTLAANEVSLNYTYFSVAFKRHTGTTFPAFLRRIRIERARELLEDPTLRINEIARKAGFLSARLFTRSFREEVGVTPLEYRRAHAHVGN